jgi:hypothetical protein
VESIQRKSRAAAAFGQWNGRRAIFLNNGVVEMTVLPGGGHVAEFRFSGLQDVPQQNVLWEPLWLTCDPNDERVSTLSAAYGPRAIGKFLASCAGHVLCLDYFGPPSGPEESAGLAMHGEASTSDWAVYESSAPGKPPFTGSVILPFAGLRCERKIWLGRDESVAYVQENVANMRATSHDCHWVQHVTFGPPFLDSQSGSVITSGFRGVTWPEGYDGDPLLVDDREFKWPFAPRRDGGFVDLRRPFSYPGQGFLAAVQFDQIEIAYVVAINWRLRLCAAYCFRRTDFPWMTVWEENRTRMNMPWNGAVRVRGMEFGTTPMPLGREEVFRRGALFDSPTWATVPKQGEKAVRYLNFLAVIPAEVRSVNRMELHEDAIAFYGDRFADQFAISARGCKRFLSYQRDGGSSDGLWTQL